MCMKKKGFRRTMSLALSVVLLGALLPVTSRAAQTSDSFYRELAQLLREDSSDYFGAMEMTIGASALKVDGRQQALDVAPDIKNGRTMLPIRAIAENAGATVGYDGDRRAVTISNDYGDEIVCTIGSGTMMVNSQAHTLDAAPYIENGRTYLPVRAVAEALNLDVGWDGATSTVTLTAPYQTARVLALGSNVDTGGLGAKKVIQDGAGMWVLQFDNPNQAKQAVETLRSRGVTAVGDAITPDPRDERSSLSSGQSGHNSWGAEECNFDAFIRTYSGQFQGSATVAVVDSGVDLDHPYLRGRLLSGVDFIDGDSSPDDECGHGTHVSATIVDCAGSAPVRILPVRCLDANNTGYTSTIAAAIKYAADHGADVINLSLGGEGDNPIMDNAVNYAVSRGALVVIAAGNDNKSTSGFCPAHMTTPGTVVVSAGSMGRSKADFSNYGNSVDLMAPGLHIYAAALNGEYWDMSGTSMAAPHVSAAAALLDLATGKSLSPSELEQKVQSATDGNGRWSSSVSGYGFLDMSRADVGSTAKPVVKITNREPVYDKNKTHAEVDVECTFSNTTLETFKMYAGTSKSNLSLVETKDIRTASSPRSDTISVNMEAVEGDLTLYYQVGYVAGGVEYKSDFITITKTSAAKPSVNITLYKPEVEGDTARLGMSCAYSNTTLEKLKIHIGTSPSDLKTFSLGNINSSSSPYSGHYTLNMSGMPGGTTWYYQYEIEARGQTYRSQVASVTSEKKEEPPQTTDSNKVTFEMRTPSYNEQANLMTLTARAYFSGACQTINVYTNSEHPGSTNGGSWTKVGTAILSNSLGNEKHIFYELKNPHTEPLHPMYYRFGVVLEDGKEYISDWNRFTVPIPEAGSGSASVGKVTRDSSGRVSVSVDYSIKGVDSVESVLVRSGDSKAQVGFDEVVLTGKPLPAKGSYSVGFGNLPRGTDQYFQLEFYNNGKLLYRTKVMHFGA